MANDTTAKFSIVLPDEISGSANAAADSLEALRERIHGGEDAIKNMRAAFNRLRGSTDDVKAAKAQLTARLNAERDAISQANLKLLKSGTTYDQVTAKAKKLGAELKNDLAAKTNALSSAVSTAGGPVASLRDKLKLLGEIAGGSGGGMGIVTLAAAGLAAAVLAVTVACVAGVVSLAKWIAESANAARSMNLMREAASGSAANAYALGTQVDALAEKVPTGKAALNELAVSMAKSGIQGQTLVDTLNAVGQANAALGDDAGGKLRELVDRGRLSQRFQVNPLELQGTGLQVDDIAKQLAKSMNVGVGAARQALVEGRVKLGDGAKAMRAAVESKFGDINLRKMLDLDVLATKFKETLANLTKDVKLEPLLEGLNRLAKLFDTSTESGAALKAGVTVMGNALVSGFTLALPLMEMFLKGVVLGALDLGIAVLQLRNYLKKTFGDSELLKGVDVMTLALSAGKAAVFLIAGAFVLLGAAVAIAVAPFALIYAALEAVKVPFAWLTETIIKTDWSALGKSIIDGLVNGLKFGAKFLDDTIRGLADSVKNGFKNALQIHSPSKVFFGYGENTTEGYAGGVESGTPEAARALSAMAAPPATSSGRAGGAGAAPASVVVHFHYHAAAGGGGTEMAKQLEDPSLKAAITKLIEDAFLGAGLPVGT